MLDLLIPQQINKVLVYPKPVSMRWGATKLRSFCADTLGAEPELDTAFLFTNKKQDALLLYLVDEDGDRILTKRLERGSFLVPTAKPDGPPSSPCAARRCPSCSGEVLAKYVRHVGTDEFFDLM